VRETLAITDRAYIIYQGKILTSGPSASLPDDPVAREYYLGERFNI
jgi:lipopolysaccharide export system ATP-binding protein